MKSLTQQFYESNVHELTTRYESADMTTLHQLFIKHIPTKSKVIDIGFGSGRDLAFLQSNGHSIYGIDPVEAFVIQVQNRFSNISDHFQMGSFHGEIPAGWKGQFNAVISIAVWMHLKVEEYTAAFYTMRSLLKEDGIIIVTFSLNRKNSQDERYFEPLELQGMIDKFIEAGFALVDSERTSDSLGRDTVQWETVILKI